MPAYCHLVSGSFNSLSRVLFNFPSPYYCAIGLRLYLVLDVNATQIPPTYPSRGTQDTWYPPFFLRLRGYHPVSRLFPEALARKTGQNPSPITPHLPYLVDKGFGLHCCALLAVTNAISIDFFSWGYEDASTHPVLVPYGTLEDFSSWMSYSEISGSKAVCAYPKLIAAYHVLLRQPKPSHPPNGVESKQIVCN